MATKEDKKENIRNQILTASHVYCDNLAGKVFFYVVGEEYFEVCFQTNCFMHLIPVRSGRSDKRNIRPKSLISFTYRVA